MTRYWCQSCHVVLDNNACLKAGHRSVKLKLEAARWVFSDPPQLWERRADGLLERIMILERNMIPPAPTDHERLVSLLLCEGYGADAERMAQAALEARSAPQRHHLNLVHEVYRVVCALNAGALPLPQQINLIEATLTDAEDRVGWCRKQGFKARIALGSKDTCIEIYERSAP